MRNLKICVEDTTDTSLSQRPSLELTCYVSVEVIFMNVSWICPATGLEVRIKLGQAEANAIRQNPAEAW